MINVQEIFNKGYLGLQSQGFKQSIEEGCSACAYKTASGLKCAVGHVIPDEEYYISFEGHSAYWVFKKLRM
jgi:hypothetical protein